MSEPGNSLVEDLSAHPDHVCNRLERGEIVCLETTGFAVDESDRAVLTRIPEAALRHKNISYAPRSGAVGGMAGASSRVVRDALRRYSDRAIETCAAVLAPYANAWRIELASFRPMEERGRNLPVRERNDLLHLDAYPNRPSNGDRILRFFTNINSGEERVWVTSEPMHRLVDNQRFRKLLRDAIAGADSRWPARLCAAGRALGLRLPDRSPFDRAMLRLHDAMKRDGAFQAGCPKFHHRFAPGTSWLVFTDAVPHAVLEGRYALEQSFFIPRQSLRLPDLAPAAIVERFAGKTMAARVARP